MSRQHVMVRVFARCASDDAVPLLQAQLLQSLASLGALGHGQPKRYWKMPELVEFSFATQGPEQLPAVVALCAGGWTDSGDEADPSWVWNAQAGLEFLHHAVVWAEVLGFDHPAQAAPQAGK